MSYGFTEADLKRWQKNDDLGVKVEVLESPEQRYNAAKSPTRQSAGRRARATGMAFEKEIEDYTNLALLSRLAEFQRNQFDMRPKVVDGQLMFVPVSKAPVDFSFVLPSGIAGKFDCKTTKQASAFSWPQEQIHQLYELRHLHLSTDGVCPAFALVKWRAVDEIRVHWIESVGGNRVYRVNGVLVDGFDWLMVIEEQTT